MPKAPVFVSTNAHRRAACAGLRLTPALASQAPALGAIQAAQGPGASKQRPAGDLPRQGFLGAKVAPVPGDIRARSKVPASQGVLVMRVDRGSAALDVGLRPNDVIVRVNDAPVASTAALVAVVRPFRAGQGVCLTRRRERERARALKPRPFVALPGHDTVYRVVETERGRRRVIVTRPPGSGKRPAVLLVGGIGCYSLDGISPDSAYARILTRSAGAAT